MKQLVVAITLAVLAAAPGQTQHIEVFRNGTHLTIPGPEKAYTGKAIAEVLFSPTAQSALEGVQVTFAPGARTAWHNHPKGQYLIITSGVGWVQERGGPKLEVKAGDVVWTPPGVPHWHGATATSSMSHLAIWEFDHGSGGELFEHVSDEDYLAKAATPAAK